MPESLERLVARLNANSFIPPQTPTGAIVMAKSVKLKKGQEFNFDTSKGPSSKYPWDEWFNPDVKDFPNGLILIERSDADDEGNLIEGGTKRDYEVLTNFMPAKIKTAGRKRYKVVHVSRRDADGNKLVDALILKARDMTDEERAEEDVLRAEERELHKARLAKAKADAANKNGQQTTTEATEAPELATV